MILSPEEVFYIQLAYLQMTPEEIEQLQDELIREMRRLEFEALAADDDFIESLEQMARGEGRVVRPQEFGYEPDDAFKEQVHQFMADNDEALRRLGEEGSNDQR